MAGMNWSRRKRLLAANALLFAALLLLVTLNKEYVRPAISRESVAGILTGCVPNFLAAFLISLMGINAIFFRKPARGRIYAFIFSALVFIVLSIEEIKPMWGASTVFDTFDIAASALGSSLALGVYEFIRRRGSAGA